MKKKAKKTGSFAIIVRRIPWWVSALLAIGTYVAFYAIATSYKPALAPTEQANSPIPKKAPAPLVFILATTAQYVFPLSFAGAAIASILHSKNLKQLQDFKAKLAQYYQNAGYKVTPQPPSRHNGIDLTLSKQGKIYFVHCSQWRKQEVDIKPLRTFNATIKALNAKGGYFVTCGEYTEEAWEYAEGRNMELINGHRLGKMLSICNANPKITAQSLEAKTETTDYPDAWYNTDSSKPNATTNQYQTQNDNPEPETKKRYGKWLLIPIIVLAIMLTIGLIRYITERKPQDDVQSSRHLKMNETHPPLQQQKPLPKQTTRKKTTTDHPQKNTGYQKTIQWWQQMTQRIGKFNDWIKASYAQVEQQTQKQNQRGNRPASSQATADAFGRFLRSYYPGSTYDKNCSCGSIKVSPTSVATFHYKSGVQSFRWTDQNITRKTTFHNPEDTRHNTYEVSEGTNTIIVLIDTDTPKKSRYIKANMPDIAPDTKKITEKRRTSPYNTSHPTPAHFHPGPTATILNDIYPAYMSKDNMGMNEYADQLVTDPKARQRLLRYAGRLYN